jgi:uncharacterized protein (DUF885 family)
MRQQQDIVLELDRHIAWPGQRLAYKIGPNENQDSRERKLRRRGRDELLNDSTLSLDLLKKKMAKWLAMRV